MHTILPQCSAQRNEVLTVGGGEKSSRNILENEKISIKS